MTETKKTNFKNLTIYFEDPHLIVLDKPEGLLSQSDHTQEESLVTLLREYFGRNYVGLIHRLDRNTSGLMVVAKRTKSAQRLTDALQKGTLIRKYHALLTGKILEPQRWNHFLKKNEKTNKMSVFPKKTEGAKECSLYCQPLKIYRTSEGDVTLCEIQLETGRSHQIRAQASFEKHALLGDAKYGKPSNLISRPALHSHSIAFPHPMRNEILSFCSNANWDILSFE